MTGDGFWLWRRDGRTAAEWVEIARRYGATRLVVKARDGRSAMMPGDELCDFGAACKAAGLALWLWAWPYARNKDDEGGRMYVAEQARLLVEDAQACGAQGLAWDVEAQWSWAGDRRGQKLGKAITPWSEGHAEAWGPASARRAELETRAGILVDETKRLLERERLYRVSQAVCTFPQPRQHAVPFAELAAADIIMPMTYTGNLGAKVARSRLQWAALGVDHERLHFVGPSTPRRGAEGVRAMRRAMGGAACDWWSIDQAEDTALAAIHHGK